MPTLISNAIPWPPDQISGADVGLTDHAKERFHQRVKPHLEVSQASRDLVRLLPYGQFSADPPAWFVRSAATESEAYFLIGADIVLPLARDRRDPSVPVAKTCFARAAISEATRARRNAASQGRRMNKNARSRNLGSRNQSARKRFRMDAAEIDAMQEVMAHVSR